MQSAIYKAALVGVVICVLIILIAPDIDLPDSTGLRANHGAHVVISSIELIATLLPLVMLAFLNLPGRELITTRFDSPSHSLLCTFLC